MSAAAERVPGGPPEPQIIEIADEREPLAADALAVIAETFARHERQPTAELELEIAEKRLGLLSAYGFHLLTMLDPAGRAMGTVAGVYLDGVNAGLVTYLAVRGEYRGRGVAPRLRARLFEAFRNDARHAEYDELAWVLGEVQAENRWLRRLVRRRGVIPFDLTYYHPGMQPGTDDLRYVLYRQPVGDPRPELPVTLVRQMLYSIYRRAYRVRYPLARPGFVAMLKELEDRTMVGPDPEFVS